MKKLLLALFFLFVLGLAQPAHAQFSRIISIALTNNNGSNAQTFNGPFSIKVGTHCTWSVSGTIATLDCTGAATSPASPSGSIQYNNSGSFGAVSGFANGDMACFCYLNVTSDNSGKYIFSGTNTSAPMGNLWDFYQYSVDGGLYLDDTDGTNVSGFGLAPGGSFLNNTIAAGALGFITKPSFKSVALSRFMVTTHSGEQPVSGDFVLSGGWGTTAAASSIVGSDNAFKLTITSSGTGQGANPTVVFTYHGGAFGNTANAPVYVCQQQGGTGLVADITHTETTTALTMTYNSTPVATFTYSISCFGAVSGDN